MSFIARLQAVRTPAVLLMGAIALAACASIGAGGGVASGPEAEVERLRIVDRCMVQAGQGKSERDSTAPRCQCIARGVLSGVAEGEATATCSRSTAAYTEAPRRPRPKRAAAPADAPAASEAPAPAGSEAAKQQ